MKQHSAPSPAMFSRSGTGLGGYKPAENNVKLRHYASETKLSSIINPLGKFNSELKKTGFLSEAKMRAKRIAQNPKRFLEEYAKAHDTLEIVPTEVPELESFIERLSMTEHYAQKEKEMKTKAEAAKSRTFLLSMASASSLDMDATNDLLNSYSGRIGEGDGVTSDPKHMDRLVSKYMEELKGVNTRMIEDWLSQ